MDTPKNNDKRRMPLKGAPYLLMAFRYGYVWTLAVLALCLSVTWFAWRDARATRDLELRHDFDSRVEDAHSHLVSQMMMFDHILAGLDGYFAGSESISRAEFRAYVSRLGWDSMCDGLLGVGYIELVPGTRKAAHEAAVRRDGSRGYGIWPAGERESYAPAVYVEPMDARNRREIGQDMLADPVRRAAMELARDSGKATMSGLTGLVGEDASQRGGFLLFLPVYRLGAPNDTIEARRANLAGWVYAPLYIDEFMSGLYSSHEGHGHEDAHTPEGDREVRGPAGVPADVHVRGQILLVEVFDGEGTQPGSLMYASEGIASADAHFVSTKIIDLNQHRWTLRFSAPDNFGRAEGGDKAQAVAFFGVGMSLLIAALTLLLTRARQLATRTARELSAEATEASRRLEAAMREQDFLQRALDEHAIVSTTDAAGNILSVNNKFVEIAGYTREELIGKNHRMLKSGIHTPEFYQQMWDTIVSGKPWHGEVCNRKKDGGYYWVEATVMPFLGDDGLPERYVSIRTDITPLKTAKERWAFAVEGAGDGVWDWNMDTGKVSMSYGYETMLGYQPGEIEQSINSWITGVHADDLDRVQHELQHYLEGGAPLYASELRMRCKDGSYKWILCRGQIAERDAAGRPVRMIGIHTDISKRKLAEQALQESMQKFQRLVEDMGDQYIVFSHKPDGTLSYVSNGIEAVTGIAREEALGKPWQGLLDWDGDSLQRLQGEVMALLGGRAMHSESEVSFTHCDGGIRTLRIVGHPALDATGQIVAIEGVVQNITPEVEHKRALVQARDVAERANKAKSDFLASMSHELRTPMNAILGFAQLMEDDPACSADQKENLQHILKAGWHLLSLINEVLDLARVESGQVKMDIKDVDPCELVGECVSLVSGLAVQKGIALENRMKDCAHLVRGDYLRVKQVLINLLSNAIKYNRPEGSVTIESGNLADGSLRLSVRDTGRGMTAEELAQLFEPFTRFGDTDKEQGTGIGLSISRKLIEGMGGQMEVESEAGVGSVFSLVLPPVGGGASKHETSQGALSLLYIEDDPAQQSLMAKLAGRYGWRIEFGNDAPSGIEAAVEGHFDVILLDIELPGGFDGYEVKSVLDEMESLREVPVIGVSVHASPEDFERAHRAGFAAYLAKPLDPDEMERAILKAHHRAQA